jgi:hypothetical protein
MTVEVTRAELKASREIGEPIDEANREIGGLGKEKAE